MEGPSYPPARAVAPLLRDHFARHIDEARRRGHEQVASVPDTDTIQAIIEAAFWASLRREEGYMPKVSLALVSPLEALHPLHFEKPLPLAPAALTRVAAAVERAGVHLAVWREGGGWSVWGTVLAIPSFCFVLEVAAPGLLVVKDHRGDTGKFVNVAVLEGDQIKIVDERASCVPGGPSLLTSLLGLKGPDAGPEGAGGDPNVLVQLAVSMRMHGRGGSLLVVRSDDEGWRDSIVRPVSYAAQPPYTGLTRLVNQQAEDEHREAWVQALTREVEALAGLTAVDGAAIMTRDYELLAFGAKIVRRKGSQQVEQVLVSEPIEGGAPALVNPSQLGGTRHLSAAQFVSDQHDALALVASQDGRFTVFAWSPGEGLVHAHRIEALLL